MDNQVYQFQNRVNDLMEREREREKERKRDRDRDK